MPLALPLAFPLGAGEAETLVSVHSGSVIEETKVPTAVIVANPSYGVLGSVVRLDGRSSTDPNGLNLTYAWSFRGVPIGSRIIQEGFRELDSDGSLVSFSPDVVGEYVLGLKVSNGSYESTEVLTQVSIRAIMVPHARGIVPDGKWIWSYTRDVWTHVEGREFFETFWSALIQIVGSEMLKLYQADFNKSIRDIQDQYQRRWLPYSCKLSLEQDSLSFYLGNHCVGTDATTELIGLDGEAVILSSEEIVMVGGTVFPNVLGETVEILYSLNTANVSTYDLIGNNTARSGYRLAGYSPISAPTADRIVLNGSVHFSFRSDENWNLSLLPDPTLVLVGDVIHYSAGPNAGFYRIIEKTGTSAKVSKIPSSFSDATTSVTYKVNIYRPVGVRISQPDLLLSDSFAVQHEEGTNDVSQVAAGRIVVVNGRAFTILRSSVDENQRVPLSVITVDQQTVPVGLRSLPWRAPHTLISETQDFEDLGVSAGDLLLADVLDVASNTTVEVKLQVVGVDRNRLGFVLSTDDLVDGEIPSITNETYLDLSETFRLRSAVEGRDGTISFSSTAQEMLTYLNSLAFARTFGNIALDVESEIEVLDHSYRLVPKTIIRNSRIPVDETLRSVPLLQEWIQQPTVVERDGKFFQVKDGKEYELPRRPALLTENTHFVIDAEYAIEGERVYNTGSTDVHMEDGDFVDRGVQSGDEFVVVEPITLEGSYPIERVLGPKDIRLARPIPAYALSEVVSGKIRLKRRSDNRFIRIIPGRFTAAKPAPDRLWAEVSFFDNSDSIESNFGFLVGLKKEDLDAISTDINYRQAVAGLMYSYTHGSAIDKVRLGAQILLGLPFSEHAGIIRSIENDYRLDVDGNPTLGRILIEDVDGAGVPQGTMRVYTFPIDEESPELAGVDVNPDTGVAYLVGDSVKQFAPLCKGVEVRDYLTNPIDEAYSDIARLQQFHTVRLVANDNIFNINELMLVSKFLKRITPSYVSYVISMKSEFFDTVTVSDEELNFSMRLPDGVLADNISLGLPHALKYDARTMMGVKVINYDGGMYVVRKFGRDLVTVDGSNVVSSVTGGFQNPLPYEDFEANTLVRPYDPSSGLTDHLLVLEGPNTGLYQIDSVSSNTNLTLVGPTLGFEAQTGISFAVVRKVMPLLRAGSFQVTAGDTILTLGSGLRSDGIMPGDWVIYEFGGDRRLTVKRVLQDGFGSWSRVEVDEPAPFSSSPVSVDYRVYRPSLIPSPYDWFGFSIGATGTNIITSNGQNLEGLLDIGDELQFYTRDDQMRVTVLDQYKMYVTPPVPTGTWNVRIIKKKTIYDPEAELGSFNWDHLDKWNPADFVELSIEEDQNLASCVAASDSVTLQQQRTSTAGGNPARPAEAFDPVACGLRPGDLLVLTAGTNSTVDVGFGPGVYPIVSVAAGSVKLSGNLTATESVPWMIIRRR